MSRLNELSQPEISVLEANVTTLLPAMRSVIMHVLELAKADRENAATNHSEIQKQEVVLGDKVRILKGDFAGEYGTVVGIYVHGNHFIDPYYDVEMMCEVSDKYKCRTLLTVNNVINGLKARDFEVINNRATDSDTEPTAEVNTAKDVKVKVGDRVKTAGGMGTVKIVTDDGSYVGTQLDGNGWYVNMAATLPEKEEKKSTEDSEEKEPKLSSEVDMVSEGTANRLAERLCKMNREITQNAGRLQVREGAIKSDYEPQISLELDYDAYRMELAAKIAIAYAEKGRYEPWEIGAKAVEVANGVIERLKNSER